jgi:hypothetical protein
LPSLAFVLFVFSFTLSTCLWVRSALQVREREREREEEEEADEVLPTLPAAQMPKKSSLTGGVCKCFRGKCPVRRVLFSVPVLFVDLSCRHHCLPLDQDDHTVVCWDPDKLWQKAGCGGGGEEARAYIERESQVVNCQHPITILSVNNCATTLTCIFWCKVVGSMHLLQAGSAWLAA